MITADMTFVEAWPLWFREKRQTLSETSIRLYREQEKPLMKFFGQLKLSEITLDRIIDYRELRSQNAGPGLVNHEINVVGQILRRVDLWEPIRKHYKQLRVPKGSRVGLRLSDEEMVHLAEVAGHKRQWRVAFLASMVQSQTAAGPTEILSIRLR